jgi:hypothetical protein
VLLAQKLHHDGGRGQREHQAQHQRRGPAVTQRPRRQAEQQAAREPLREARAEHPAAHRPQPLGRQLQPDHEHQEHHAELGEHVHARDLGEGEAREPRRLVRQSAQPERAEQRAGGQEADDLVDAQPLEEGQGLAGPVVGDFRERECLRGSERRCMALAGLRFPDRKCPLERLTRS